MKALVLSLLGSRKFILTVLAVVTLASFVLAGKMPVSQFFTSLEHLTGILVASIAAEGVAEKWNQPLLTQAASNSIRPPPPPPETMP